MPVSIVIAEAIKAVIALAIQLANRNGMERAELDKLYEEEKAKGMENDPADLPDT